LSGKSIDCEKMGAFLRLTMALKRGEWRVVRCYLYLISMPELVMQEFCTIGGHWKPWSRWYPDEGHGGTLIQWHYYLGVPFCR